MYYRHKKTGNIYMKFFTGAASIINVTNAQDGQEMVACFKEDEKVIYVIEKTEFNEKFELIGDDE